MPLQSRKYKLNPYLHCLKIEFQIKTLMLNMLHVLLRNVLTHKKNFLQLLEKKKKKKKIENEEKRVFI